MKMKTAAAAAALGLGFLVIATSAAFQTKAQGEADFRMKGSTLTSYLGTDTFVSIPDTVTTIGEGAFAKNSTLKSVELPDGLQEIGYNAFGDCTALTSITIPDSVTKVGPGAFKGCTSLTLAELGSGISSWGSGVFNDCTSLNKLIVDEDNPYLIQYKGALYNGDMSMLYQVIAGRTGENYVMPEEVKQIDTYAFWNMQNIKNVKVSSNVTSIPVFSMSSMGSVENVILPDSVTSISEKSFANNTSLKQVMVPSSVGNIHNTVFVNSPNVSILTTKNSTADKYGQEKKIPVIYEAILPTDFNDSIAGGEKPSASHSTVVTEQTVTQEESSEQSETETEEEESGTSVLDGNPLDIQEEGVVGKTRIVAGRAVVMMDNSRQKVYGANSTSKEESTTEEEEQAEESSSSEPDSEAADNSTSKSETNSKEENSTKESSASQEKDSSDKDTVEKKDNKNAQVIEQKAYYKQKSLTNYEISEKIKEIGRLSFAQSGLKGIEIPDGVETIGYGAFYDCENLEKVTIPDSVTSIGTKAFAGTPWLDNWLQGQSEGEKDEFLIVGDGILIAYRGDASKAELPAGVKQIGSECFKGHEELTEVTIPDSVTKIGADAFRNCTKLSKINGGKGLKTIVRGAFYGTEVSEESLTKTQNN